MKNFGQIHYDIRDQHSHNSLYSDSQRIWAEKINKSYFLYYKDYAIFISKNIIKEFLQLF
jgi:hypothetical protein